MASFFFSLLHAGGAGAGEAGPTDAMVCEASSSVTRSVDVEKVSDVALGNSSSASNDGRSARSIVFERRERERDESALASNVQL